MSVKHYLLYGTLCALTSNVWGMDSDASRVLLPITAAIADRNIEALEQAVANIARFHQQEKTILVLLLDDPGMPRDVSNQMLQVLLQHAHFDISRISWGNHPSLLQYLVLSGQKKEEVGPFITTIMWFRPRIFSDELHLLIKTSLIECEKTIMWKSLADPHMADGQGNTLLHAVVAAVCTQQDDKAVRDDYARARLSSVQQLLQHLRINVNIKNNADDTPLKLAFEANIVHGPSKGPRDDVIGVLLGCKNIMIDEDIIARAIEYRLQQLHDVPSSLWLIKQISGQYMTQALKAALINADQNGTWAGNKLSQTQKTEVHALVASWNFSAEQQRTILKKSHKSSASRPIFYVLCGSGIVIAMLGVVGGLWYWYHCAKTAKNDAEKDGAQDEVASSDSDTVPIS